MAAVVIDIADAVTAALNGATLSKAFTALRAYVPVYDLTDFDAIKVTVVPRSLSSVRLSRRDDEFTYAVDVAVQKRVVSASAAKAVVTNAVVDPFMSLAEEVVDLFRGVTLSLPGGRSASNTLAENDPIYMPDHLDDMRVFTSVVRLTFKAVRAR